MGQLTGGLEGIFPSFGPEDAAEVPIAPPMPLDVIPLPQTPMIPETVVPNVPETIEITPEPVQTPEN